MSISSSNKLYPLSLPSSLVLLWTTLTLSPVVDARQNVCSLCEDGLNGLKYPDAVIKSDGTTCTGMALSVAMNYEEDSDGCYKQLEAWRQICCGDERPVDVEITEPVLDKYPDIDSIQTLGSNKKCDVCRDGDYPSASSMVINMLYIGEGTCPQYWKIGQQGLIPNHLCDAVQYFAYEPCGCGKFSTNGNYNWGNSYDGETPASSSSNNNEEDDDNEAWWSSANGNFQYYDSSSSSSEEDDDEAWWSSANGNQGSTGGGGRTDDEAPWWAAADSSAVSSALPPKRQFVMIAGVLLIVASSFSW